MTAGLRGSFFRNACLDLADKVGADIGSLGEDAAAEPREDRDQRGAEGKSNEPIYHFAAIGGMACGADQKSEEARNGEQGQPRHQQAGDRTGAEGERQSLLQPALRGGGGADVGSNRDVHAHEACHARQDRADHESDRRNDTEKDEDQHRDDYADNPIVIYCRLR